MSKLVYIYVGRRNAIVQENKNNTKTTELIYDIVHDTEIVIREVLHRHRPTISVYFCDIS